MNNVEEGFTVHTPKNLGELAALLQNKPNLKIFSGGTLLLENLNNKKALGEWISIQRVEELKRLGRSERFLDIGAAVTLPDLLKLGAPFLPQSLIEALEGIGPYGVHNLATIGGNLCAPDVRLDTFPVLLAIGARMELKNGRQVRWLPINRFFDAQGNLAFEEGEFLSKIRFPLEDWTQEQYIKIGKTSYKNRELILCSLAQVSKGILQDLRIVYLSGALQLHRSRILEAELTGRKVPFNQRDLRISSDLIEKTLEDQNLSPWTKEIIRRQNINFLMQLS